MNQPAHGLEKGFTLVELLIVIVILAVLASIAVVVINPAELQKQSRDSARLQDLDNLQKSIAALSTNTNNPNDISYCFNTTAPCTANSNDPYANVRNIDGTGWVKVNFSAADSVTFNILPVDPVNNSNFHYTYQSDGKKYEIDAKMESQKYQSKMTDDGGNNPNAYEVGTDLTLIN